MHHRGSEDDAGVEDGHDDDADTCTAAVALHQQPHLVASPASPRRRTQGSGRIVIILKNYLTMKLVVDTSTHIVVEDDGPKRSMLYIETANRPGLLLQIIKILADTNIDMESADVDTEGSIAKDKFHVSYRGAKLNSSLSQALIVILRYYLRTPETDEDNY